MSIKTKYICDNCGKGLEGGEEDSGNGIFSMKIIVKRPDYLKQIAELDFCNVSCLIEKFAKVLIKKQKI